MRISDPAIGEKPAPVPRLGTGLVAIDAEPQCAEPNWLAAVVAHWSQAVACAVQVD